ncbi:hypothetical protein M569_12778 [Genlisea aurea]|uniref:DEAD/DEAH-box helicase domain-containing protein n=1 Tax=Genlisea aurea TaxID=192259 RepID=S8C5D4_9LAMI|nr:hypothetical protein M569_12778 [Genlisea aurea]
MDEPKVGFKDLFVYQHLADLLKKKSILEPKPIQLAAFPYLKRIENDIVIRGVNGSGKTCAYLIYLMEAYFSNSLFVVDRQLESVIIILPTPELCQQVSN